MKQRRKNARSRLTPSAHSSWIGVFILWVIFLSGVIPGPLASPGMIQAIRLRNLLQTKEKQLRQNQQELLQLKKEVSDLQTKPSAQLREIRRVLGYAAADELIFDFNAQGQYR